VALLLKSNAKADFANVKGTTALMRASQEGHAEISKLLIKNKADVNRKNLEGMNALMLASQRGHDEMARLLTNHGAAMDEQTTQGSTALMLCCKRGHDKVVEVLVSMGAEIHIRDCRGRTALETAMRRQHQHLLYWLDTKVQNKELQHLRREKRASLLDDIYSSLQMEKLSLSAPALMLKTLQERHFGPSDSKEVAPTQKNEVAALQLMNEVMPSLNDAPVAPMMPLRRGYADWQWHTLLLKCFVQLPEGIVRHILELLPLPRLWQWHLFRLKKRCKLAPQVAVQDLCRIMDEILADANIFQGPSQTGLLLCIARNPQIHSQLVTFHGMNHTLISQLVKHADLQGLATWTTEADVTFRYPVARKLLQCARLLYLWYTARSNHSRISGLMPERLEQISPRLSYPSKDALSAALSVDEDADMLDHDTETELPNEGDGEEDEEDGDAEGEEEIGEEADNATWQGAW
jgi:hypothetical protein